MLATIQALKDLRCNSSFKPGLSPPVKQIGAPGAPVGQLYRYTAEKSTSKQGEDFSPAFSGLPDYSRLPIYAE